MCGRLGKIDLTEAANKPIGTRFGVRGYPTLKIFREGKEYGFSAARDAASIVTYLKDEVVKVR